MKEMITNNRHHKKKHRIDREKREEMKIFLQAALWALKDGLSLCDNAVERSLNKQASSEQKTAEEKIVMGEKRRGEKRAWLFSIPADLSFSPFREEKTASFFPLTN